MSAVSYDIHSEYSRAKYLLYRLLDLLTYNCPLTALWLH